MVRVPTLYIRRRSRPTLKRTIQTVQYRWRLADSLGALRAVTELFQTLRVNPAKICKPAVAQFGQGLGVQRIGSRPAVTAEGYHPALAKHPQVSGNSRTRSAIEFCGDLAGP